ncbi:MAG: Peptidase M23, partial [Candidatus Peregrinibacteria bacterium GW2011_GWA2_47_7]
MRRQLMLIVFLLLGGGAQAFGWELPLNQWIESGNGFWSCTRKCYHLGEDLRADTDDMVYAIGEGTVVDVSRRTRFGTVILIEHETGDGHIVSLYGHLGRDDDSARIDDVFVAVGDTVNAGQEIGRIGDRDENGDWPPHLHFGINRGAYRGDGSLCYGWEYAGYTADAYAENDDCFCETLSEWL